MTATLRDYDREGLIVGMLGGTLVPLVGIILGAKLVLRGNDYGWIPLVWCLLLAVVWGVALAMAFG